MNSLKKENFTLQVTARTDTGLQREANEDNFIVSYDLNNTEWILPKDEYENSESGTVLVIADGMGGLNAGEVASKIVVESMCAYLSDPTVSIKEPPQLLVDAILNANTSIVNHGKKYPETVGMGSTVVTALIRNSNLYVAWIGDSRCYVLRERKLIQVSADHSYVQSLVDQGKITKEQAFIHPESNIITQSLGDGGRKPRPDTRIFSLQQDDLVLLCSDGLNGMLMDDAIEAILNQDAELSQLADQLIKAANDEGGVDNITVVLAKVINGRSEAPFVNPGAEKKKKKRDMPYIILLIALIAIGCGYYWYNKKTQVEKPASTGTPGLSGEPDSVRKSNRVTHTRVDTDQLKNSGTLVKKNAKSTQGLNRAAKTIANKLRQDSIRANGHNGATGTGGGATHPRNSHNEHSVIPGDPNLPIKPDTVKSNQNKSPGNGPLPKQRGGGNTTDPKQDDLNPNH